MENIKKFETTLTNFGEVNNGFIRATVNVFTKDQVANGFEFQDSGIEKRRKQWAYIPVVAEYIDEKEDVGGHGGKLTISDSEFKFERTTVPMGVVINDTDRYEDVVCMNGETKNYFCVDVYLWYEQFEKELSMFRNGESRSQSMEVRILDSIFEDGVEKVSDFEPMALCILGKDVPPAYKDSKVKVSFESSEFKANFNKMMDALDKYINKFNEEGGDKVEEEMKEVQIDTKEKMEEETQVEAEQDTESQSTDGVEMEETPLNEDTVEMKDEENDDEEMAKKRKCEEVNEEEPVNYEEKFNELTLKFDSLQKERDELMSKFEDVNSKYQVYVEMEDKSKKETLMKSFSDVLTNDEISACIQDISKFTLDEIETALTLEVGKKERCKKKDITFSDKKEVENTFINFNSFDNDNYFAQLARKIKTNN